METIIGGLLIILSILVVWYIPNKLTKLSIYIAEWIKPGIWYARPFEKNVFERGQITLLWVTIIGGGIWICDILYVYPFLMSLVNG